MQFQTPIPFLSFYVLKNNLPYFLYSLHSLSENELIIDASVLRVLLVDEEGNRQSIRLSGFDALCPDKVATTIAQNP